MSLEASVQDKFPLLHLLNLVSKESILSDISQNPRTEQPDPCIIDRRLHPDDAAILATLKSEDVQDWCLSRIAEFQAPITAVRAQPDLALYNASLHEFIVRHKSHIWALRSAYNDAAPIHRHLPPEILLDIFAHLHHDGTRQGPPVLRVCHYWHALLQRTPQLWQSLLNLEFQAGQELSWKAKRFAEALSRSAPLDLSLRLRSIDHALVDVLATYSRRFISITLIPFGRSHEFEPLYRFLQLDMPLLRCLRICRWLYVGKETRLSATHFFMFSHLETLCLENMHLGPPEVLLPMLRHLQLTNCREHVPPNPSSPVNARHVSLHTLFSIIKNCPNLETLFVKGGFPQDTPWSGLDLPITVSRLRHLKLEFVPSQITPTFLSHLVLPSTTALDLTAAYWFAGSQILLSASAVIPLGEAPPVAEVSMSIRSSSIANNATWEAQGYANRSRPFRMSMDYYSAAHHPDAILRSTSTILAVFEPGSAVTSLTITSGRNLRREDFWTEILAALPHLTRLVVHAGRAGDYPRILPILGKPQASGGCLCPILTDLSVIWDPQTDPEVWAVLVVEDPQATSVSAGVEHSGEPWTVAGGTREYCRFLQQYLRSRAELGCLPLRALSVSIWDHGYRTTVEEGLREGLEGFKDLVGEVSVRSLRSKRRK